MATPFLDIAHYANLLATGPVAVIIWRRDAEWRAVTVTPNIEHIIGYDAESLLSGDIEYADLIHEQDNPLIFERVGIATTGGAPEFSVEYRIIDRHGAIRKIYDRTFIERDPEGEPTAFRSYIYDFTNEAREDAARDFIAHMSHEIRNPLSGVLGLAEALAETKLDAAQREIVDSLREAGDALTQLVNNVLDLSKIDAGKMQLDIGNFRLGELCVAAERLFSPRASAKGVTLTTRGQAMDVRLRGDAARLRQVLVNLVSNAVKFTDEGSVEIEWSCAPPDEKGRMVAQIRVRDTGPGMNEATVEALFQSYRQADATVSSRYGGTGLGLAISYELAQLMGGRLWAESAPGEGSTFIFEATFEASVENEPEIAALEREEANARARAAIAAYAPRVLAAEDAVANQRVLELLLGAVHAEVVIARDGREAVEQFEKEGFDLVLMDSRMPRLGGIEATAEIRRAEEKLGRKRAPILALTAEVQTHVAEAFANAGADAVLPKPFDPQALYRAIAAALPPRE